LVLLYTGFPNRVTWDDKNGYYLFVLRTRKAATSMTMSEKTRAIQIGSGIFAIQGEVSVSFGTPFDGETGVGSGLETSFAGGDATLNDMTLDH